MKARVVWQEDLTFEAELNDFHFLIDAEESVGGKNKGPRPKGLTLVSLAGCTGMDVISILKKMRVEVRSFEVETRAKLTEEHPKKFVEILTRYILTGDNLPLDKIKKAVSLSEDRYCGVSATLKPSVELKTEIIVNGKKVSEQ